MFKIFSQARKQNNKVQIESIELNHKIEKKEEEEENIKTPYLEKKEKKSICNQVKGSKLELYALFSYVLIVTLSQIDFAINEKYKEYNFFNKLRTISDSVISIGSFISIYFFIILLPLKNEKKISDNAEIERDDAYKLMIPFNILLVSFIAFLLIRLYSIFIYFKNINKIKNIFTIFMIWINIIIYFCDFLLFFLEKKAKYKR